jgi:hypothetical protein
MKKLLASLVILCLLCGMGAMGVSATGADLRYGADGKFRILVFTDTHQHGTDYPEMITFMGEALDYAKPDLVVFDGDNVAGSACENAETELAAIAKILGPVTERGLPFAFVYGNHDQEYKPGGQDGRAAMMAMYRSFPGCLAYDALGDGKSVFNLPLYSGKDASKRVSNLWFFDSGNGAPEGYEGYDWVHKDQIDWYLAESAALQAQNGGQKVPSLAFQHIPVPETCEVYPAMPFEIPKLTMTFLGKHRLLAPNFLKFDGVILERVSPPFHSEGQFDAWTQRGDIVAAIFGHDHANDFIAKIRGIDLVGCPSTTFYTDGADVNRGATLFVLDESKPWSYSKQPVSYRALSKRPGSQVKARSDDDRFYVFWTLYILETGIQGVLWPGKALARAIGGLFR